MPCPLSESKTYLEKEAAYKAPERGKTEARQRSQGWLAEVRTQLAMRQHSTAQYWCSWTILTLVEYFYKFCCTNAQHAEIINLKHDESIVHVKLLMRFANMNQDCGRKSNRKIQLSHYLILFMRTRQRKFEITTRLRMEELCCKVSQCLEIYITGHSWHHQWLIWVTVNIKYKFTKTGLNHQAMALITESCLKI